MGFTLSTTGGVAATVLLSQTQREQVRSHHGGDHADEHSVGARPSASQIVLRAPPLSNRRVHGMGAMYTTKPTMRVELIGKKL